MTVTRHFAAFALGAAAVISIAAPIAAQAQERAHVHGQVRLDVAIDGQTIVIGMEMPLDTLVGFERTPKTAAEKKTADAAIARLRAADTLFITDPAAGCKPQTVMLSSNALGVDDASGAGGASGVNGVTAISDAASKHADLDATFTFDCSEASAARFIDVALFTTFSGTRQIEVQLATPQGQFRRTLRRGAGTTPVRLTWGR